MYIFDDYHHTPARGARHGSDNFFVHYFKYWYAVPSTHQEVEEEEEMYYSYCRCIVIISCRGGLFTIHTNDPNQLLVLTSSSVVVKSRCNGQLEYLFVPSDGTYLQSSHTLFPSRFRLRS